MYSDVTAEHSRPFALMAHPAHAVTYKKLWKSMVVFARISNKMVEWWISNIYVSLLEVIIGVDPFPHQVPIELQLLSFQRLRESGIKGSSCRGLQLHF